MIEIEHAERLSDLFGHWPDFHDAEIRALRLASPGRAPAALELDVDVAEMSREVDERGYFKPRQRCSATLRFEDVVGASLTDFGLQNVLDAIVVTELSPAEYAGAGGFWGGRRYRVQCVPIAGFCEVDLLCERIIVVRARSLLDGVPGEIPGAAI